MQDEIETVNHLICSSYWILFYFDLQKKFIQLEACIHPFFDELRDPNCHLPNGRPLPPLFNFKPQGITFY
jgi:hypothetical protein